MSESRGMSPLDAYKSRLNKKLELQNKVKGLFEAEDIQSRWGWGFVAAAAEPDWAVIFIKETEQLGAALAGSFAKKLLAFLVADVNPSSSAWASFLMRALGKPVEADVRRHLEQLRERGFEVPEAQVEALVREATEAALGGAGDLLDTLIHSPDPDSLKDGKRTSLAAAGGDGDAPGGPLSLTALLGVKRIKEVISSLARSSRDNLERALFKLQGREFTGRRRWVASDPNGRFGAIHLQVESEPGAGWDLLQRTVGSRNYSASHVDHPRGDPRNVELFSGSKSTVQYEVRNARGKIIWK